MSQFCGEDNDSKASYNSLINFTENRFRLDDDMKKACLEALDNNLNKASDNTHGHTKASYSTTSSRWVRSKRLSHHVLSLLKVKRWLLTDEDLIFDPLKKCQSQVELTPYNTLWSTFGKEEHAWFDLQYCLDGIIALGMVGKEALASLGSLKALDSIFDLLDQFHQPKTHLEYQAFLKTVKLLPTQELYAAAPLVKKPFSNLVRAITTAVNLSINGEAVPDKIFENVFSHLVQCVAACLGDETMTMISCQNNIDGRVQARMQLDVKLEGAAKKSLGFEIKAVPDLFVFATRHFSAAPSVVLAVVTVKGMHKDTILHSDDEDTHDETRCSSKQNFKQNLPVLEEDEDEDDETEMEKLVSSPLEWLRSTITLPYSAQCALQKFLPQLIGDMLCVSRSKKMLPLKMEDGLLFGVGVIGFDVYFVSVMDSCRNSPESVINTESAITNVFVTRPLNLFVKKDRRIILKTICASLMFSPAELLR